MFEDRAQAIEIINRVDIPKVLLSKAVSLDPRRITDFVKYRPVPEPDVARIKDAVRKIEFIYAVFAPYRISFDTPELLERAYDSANRVNNDKIFAASI